MLHRAQPSYKKTRRPPRKHRTHALALKRAPRRTTTPAHRKKCVYDSWRPSRFLQPEPDDEHLRALLPCAFGPNHLAAFVTFAGHAARLFEIITHEDFRDEV